MQVDLRSDTVTKPSPGMLNYMTSVEVGDDVFGEDPTVISLEQKLAAMFGKEAGLFCPSGTMANQVGIKALTAHGEEVICDYTSHIYLYEGGGLAFNSGLSPWLLQGNRGRLSADQVAEAIRPENVHYPRTSLVALENTHNRGGGSIYALEEIAAIHQVCKKHHLKMHLDGARIFNAITGSAYNTKDIGKYFDTISVCLSKGLGAPVGSVLLAGSTIIHQARRIRKVMGGGMRQAGILAAAGIYALDHNLPGLKEDHRRAKVLEATLQSLGFVTEVLPADTNIVVTKLSENFTVQSFIEKMAAKNIRVVQFGKQSVRMVTHLDFNDDMLEYVCGVLKKLN